MERYGTHRSGIPFYRSGSGSRPLVVVPGVMDSLGWNTPTPLSATLLGRYYFRGFRGYDLWVASRPPGLVAGESARQMAERYVPLLEDLEGAAVVGFSLGGAIGCHLAHDHPELVDQLVLVACGTRLGAAGHTTVHRWRNLAGDGNWRALHVDYATRMYSGLSRLLAPLLYRVASPVLPRPVVGSDVVRSCEALLRFDGRGVLEEVDVPTLVVADTCGPLFPTAIQRDAARRVPDGYVATFEGSHAVYEQSRREFTSVVRRFLSGEHTD